MTSLSYVPDGKKNVHLPGLAIMAFPEFSIRGVLEVIIVKGN